ncbi:KH domain-containing protein [Dichanthelium oligosanthes]|uniref:KH domain-containing protein n=1 Tax=Dichanthelium oligosanthes TaxID=888268 RepID=A0A1E5WCA0_9POAL|nr:KH domain-containing protein [Dichanthelium oligosanthes]
MASRMTPSKRPFQKNSSDHNGRGKWQKTKHSSSHKYQFKIEPGVPIFRILCPASKSGNVIGRAGSIIAKIQQETGVKISVDKAVLGCDERVIFISAIQKDEEASSEQGRGIAVSAGGDHEKDKVNSKEEKDDPEKNHIKEEKDDSEIDHKDDSEIENSKEDKDDSEKGRIKQEKDNDSEKDYSKEENDDDSEKDHSKEEKDDPVVAKGTKSEPERVLPSALKAILFVFDRIFAAEDGNETGDASGASTPVSLRLLVLYSQAGWLLGKGGRVVKQMSVDNCCEIRVSKDNLPSCALSNDRLCQITGEVDSVKKGLNAVAELLLAHPPKETDVVAGVHSSGSSSRSLFGHSDGFPSRMQHNFHIPLQGPSQANGPFDIIDRQPNIAPFPILPEAPIHGHASIPIEPLSFRLLCSKDKVGSIIGKGGNTVKTIQNDTGCEIKVHETVPKTDDRIIRISGPAVTTFNVSCCKIFVLDFYLPPFTHPGDGISPAQNAILHVQRKLMLPTSDKEEGPAMCRLIVSPNQVGCLLGKGGSIIAEMRKLSGAFIVVLSKDKIPRGVPEHDEVIQVCFFFVLGCEAIQEALMQITARLRNHLFRDRMPAMGPNMRPPFGLLDSQFGPYAGNHESPSLFHKDFMGQPLDGIPAPWTVKGMCDVGDPMSISDIPGTGHREFGGFSGPGQSSVMPNLTAEVLVPRLVLPALCGEDRGCLDRIREFSEAKITVAEPITDAMDTTVLISGTPDQMHAARSLVQAFVISESFAT